MLNENMWVVLHGDDLTRGSGWYYFKDLIRIISINE